jgi:ribosomal protein S18 acetylase RimI-like enzyme
MIELRPLDGVEWEALAAAFELAFSDYPVPMRMTGDALAAMQLRRGYQAACSFGAFAGGRLVGFSLTCVDGDAAYDSGTGVAPAFRRGGLARRLVEAALRSAAAAGQRRFVLEVLEENAPAAALYRRLGFVETRRLQCWSYAAPAAAVAVAAPAALGQPVVAGEAVAAVLRPLCAPAPALVDALCAEVDVAIAAGAALAPSWQSSLASIRRAPEPHLTLADEHGLAIVFPRTADLPLLYVRPASRRRGHGRRLLAAAHAALDALAASADPGGTAAAPPRSGPPAARAPLRLLNLDERDVGVSGFLSALGAVRTVRQLEMQRPLP